MDKTNVEISSSGRKERDLRYIMSKNFREQISFFEQFKAYRKDKFVILEFSAPCYNNCICCTHKQEESSNIDNLKNIIKENLELQVKKLILVANDPLCHPDILKILDYAKSMNFKEIEVITSGEFFSSLSVTTKLVSSGLNIVSIPLYGLNKVHDVVVRRPGSFDKVIKGINNLTIKKKVKIHIHSLLLKQNIKQCLELSNLVCSKLGLPLTFLHLRHKIRVFNYENLMPSYSEIIKKFKSSNLNFIGYPLCILKEIAPQRFENIILNKRHYSKQMFWKIEKDIADSTFIYSRCTQYCKLDMCQKCKVKDYCPGVVPEYIECYGSCELNAL